MRAPLFLLLLPALLLPLAAGAYPVPRAGAEAPISFDAPALSRGPWQPGPEGVALAPTKDARNYLLSRTASAQFLRVRLRQGGKADLAVLFRAQVVREEPLLLTGYGLSIDTKKGRVDLLRWDEGGVRDPGVEKKVPALRGLADVEACLWLAGPNFVAVIFDGRTKEPLATLAWSDPSYSAGVVGLYAHSSHDPAARVLLSGPATAAASAAPGSAPAPPPAPPAGGSPGGSLSRPWLSKSWLAVVSPADKARIPREAAGLFRRLGVVRREEVPLLTTEAGVHVLSELGVTPLAAHAGVPFRYLDPGFTLRSRARVAATAEGISFVDGLKDGELVERHLRAFAARFPQRARLLTVGTSAEGRPILGLRISGDLEDRARPQLLLVAAHHPGEAVTPEFPLDAARYLLQGQADPRVAGWLAKLSVVIVPLANPDGTHAFWHVNEQLGRKSRGAGGAEPRPELGVDLNRNYPFRWGVTVDRFNSDVPGSAFYRGASAGSEPEVQALMALARRERFAAAVSYHGAATKLLVPYTIDGVDGPRPSAAWAVGEELIAQLPHPFKGKRYEAVRQLYPVSGTEQDWYFHELGTLAYLIEAPITLPRSGQQLAEVIEHTRPSWQFLLDRWLAGPSLSIRAVDAATGAPVSAEVELLPVELRAGERWTTRPDTGWLHQYLPGPGAYTVRARLGERVAEQAFRIETGVKTVELAL